jgi:hypothetical protein
MATSTLATKLQIKAGQAIMSCNAPASYGAALEPLPEGATLVATGDLVADVVHLFVHDSAELAVHTAPALAALKPGGMLWISYPKRSSGVATDLTRDAGWTVITAAGWQPVRQIAVDEVWSAVRFKRATVAPAGDPVDAHFAGERASLRPIYERVAAAILGLGTDVEAGVRESYIAFRRNQQFAVVKMAARPLRVELGLRLPGYAPTDRLLEAGKSLGAESATHKVVLTVPEDMDAGVAGWLAAAYEGA